LSPAGPDDHGKAHLLAAAVVTKRRVKSFHEGHPKSIVLSTLRNDITSQ
jgi:hypothetical protein